MARARRCGPRIDGRCGIPGPAVQEPQLGEESQSLLFGQTSCFDTPEPLPAGQGSRDHGYSAGLRDRPRVRADVSGNGSERFDSVVGETGKIKIFRGLSVMYLVAGQCDTKSTGRGCRSVGPFWDLKEQMPAALKIHRRPDLVPGDRDGLQQMCAVGRA